MGYMVNSDKMVRFLARAPKGATLLHRCHSLGALECLENNGEEHIPVIIVLSHGGRIPCSAVFPGLLFSRDVSLEHARLASSLSLGVFKQPLS